MTHQRGSWLSNSWLVSLGSLAAVGILVLLLWEPWNKRGIAAGKTLRFFCAAGAIKPVAAVLKDYQSEYGVAVQPTYKGSGDLFSDIKATGGAGDLLLTADTDTMRIAQKGKWVREAIPVAVLRPVIVIRKDKQAELKAKGKAVASIQDLLRDDLKVVVARESTSIGKASRDVLTPSGVWTKLKERQGQAGAKVSEMATVMEVAGTVHTRSDFVGIVWNGVAKQYKELEIITTPELDEFQGQMWIGVLTHSTNPTAALQFARYLSARDKGLVHFEKNYFERVADADVWAERPRVLLDAGAMLKPGLDDVVKAFKVREGVDLETRYDGCGQLVAGMKAIKVDGQAGRFPDAYFACDIPFLDMVSRWFERPRNVTKNDVVLIVPPGNPKNIRSLEDLGRLAGSEARIGLGHETKSALGALTAELAKKKGVYQSLYSKRPPENVVYQSAAHTLVNQMAVAGALDAAVVYRSNVQSHPPNLKKIEIVELDEGRQLATQPFAIAKDSEHKHLMKRLFDSIVDAENSVRFKAAGFEWVFEAGK